MTAPDVRAEDVARIADGLSEAEWSMVIDLARHAATKSIQTLILATKAAPDAVADFTCLAAGYWLQVMLSEAAKKNISVFSESEIAETISRLPAEVAAHLVKSDG